MHDGRVGDRREVDEAAFGIGVNEFHPHSITDVQPRVVALDPALHRRVEGPDPGTLGAGPGDEPIQFHADTIAEQALAHTIDNKTERAYRRGDAFERRKDLMQQWADYLTRDALIYQEKWHRFIAAS